RSASARAWWPWACSFTDVSGPSTTTAGCRPPPAGTYRSPTICAPWDSNVMRWVSTMAPTLHRPRPRLNPPNTRDFAPPGACPGNLVPGGAGPEDLGDGGHGAADRAPRYGGPLPFHVLGASVFET